MMDIANDLPIAKPEQEIVSEAKEKSGGWCGVTEEMQQPLSTVDFRQSEIKSLNAKVETGPLTYYNSYYGSSWIMHLPGRSFIKVSTNIDHLAPSKKVRLDLFHLSSVVGGSLTDSPITIEVNGRTVVTGHNPNNGNYISEQFDITDFVKEGENVVELKFDAGARTNYWIQSFAIVQL
jgi:hypothetical protein